MICGGMKLVWLLSGRLDIEIGPTAPRRFAVLFNMQEGERRGPELAWDGQLIARECSPEEHGYLSLWACL